jgi:signal transduction histidine kinase
MEMENLELKDHLKRLEKKLYVTYGIGLLILVILSLFSSFILKEQVARQATSLIKRTVQRGDYRETIYTLNDAKLDYFNAVVYYNEDGNRLFSLPADLDPEFVVQKNISSRLFYSWLSIDLFFDRDEKHEIGSVLFIFWRFSHVPYALLIWLFFVVGTIPLVRNSRQRVIEDYKKHVLLSEEVTRAELARRVRHDIRSPLGALQIGIHDLSALNPKQQTLIRRATERISEIVSELELIRVSQIDQASVGMDKSFPQSVLTLVQTIIQEKRTQLAYRSDIIIVPQFSTDAFFLFADVKCSELKRSLSNVIDNGIEACSARGQIVIRIGRNDENVVIDVEDNGKGISPESLPLVTNKGFTNKQQGSGLGLYYAKKTVEDAGGALAIESRERVGTKISIHLPACEPPKWYVPVIKVPGDGTVVILDDQESTHLSLRMRLDELKDGGAKFSVVSFTAAADFLRWYSEHGKFDPHVLYLLDHDLGQGQRTGLDMARELNLKKNAILVTGHYDSEEIQELCSESGLGLLPKSYLSSISLRAI